MRPTTRYFILRLNNGLLLPPEDRWGGNAYNPYGYDTYEEAIQALVNDKDYSEYTILPKLFWVMDNDTNQ